MIDVVPAILVTNLRELKVKAKSLQWAKKLHIDVMDGLFVDNKTLSPEVISKFFPRAKLQFHVMARNPLSFVSRCVGSEFIFHAEATKSYDAVIDAVRRSGMLAGLALNPRSRVSSYRGVFKRVDIALIMTVQPGFGGQRFLEFPLKKVAELKRINRKLSIGVDGGINHSSCCFAIASGVDWLVAGSAVSKAINPKKSFDELRNCMKK